MQFEGVPNAFITIFNKTKSAEQVIDSSPIRYRLIAEPAPDTAALDPTKTYDGPPDTRSPEMKALDAVHEGEDIADAPDSSTEKNQTSQERIFEIRLSTSQYPHRQIIQRGPLYGSWKPISPRRSAIAADLIGKIPREKLLGGLRDWETGALGTIAAHGTSSDDWSEESGGASSVQTSHWNDSMPWRLRGKVATDGVVIRSLKQLYEERLKGAADEEMKL